MFDRAALDAFTQSLTINSAATGDMAKQLIADVVDDERARVRAEARNRSPEKPTSKQIVDGRIGAPVSSVRPDGRVIIEWEYMREVVAEIMAQYRAETPRMSGRYQQSITMFIGPEERRGTIADIDANTNTVLIGAVVPYSRRLEIGVERDKTPFSNQKTWYMTERVKTLTKARYGKVVILSDEWFELPDDAMLKRAERMRYPGIRVRSYR